MSVKLAAAILEPSGENATLLTLPETTFESHFPVLMFQIFTVLSPLPLAKDAASGLQATDMTLRFDEMSQHAKQLDKRRKLDKTAGHSDRGDFFFLNKQE